MLSRSNTCGRPSRSTTGWARTSSSPTTGSAGLLPTCSSFDGQAYDSKAILGVAYQLAAGKPMGPHDFSGGVQGAAGVLRRMGF